MQPLFDLLIYIDPETASMEDLKLARKECLATVHQLNQAIRSYRNTKADIMERWKQIHNEILKRRNQNNQ